jgi:hypothetical protein
MKYVWTINQIDCKPQESEFSDVVACVHWQLTATEETYISSVIGAVDLIAYNGKDLFIAYKDLTEEIVLTWVQDKLGENEIGNLKTYLADLIKNQQVPQIVTLDLPWAVTQPMVEQA